MDFCNLLDLVMRSQLFYQTLETRFINLSKWITVQANHLGYKSVQLLGVLAVITPVTLNKTFVNKCNTKITEDRVDLPFLRKRLKSSF